VVAMPRRALEQETVLPPLLVHIQAHVDIPALPVPHPARVGYLRIRNVDSRRLKLGVDPWRGVNPEVPQCFRREERYAEDEPAALVLVEYVDVRVGGSRGLRLACGGVVAVCVVDKLDVLLGHRV
jgi:hypothetical protein